MRLEEGPQSPLEVGDGGVQRRKISHIEEGRGEEGGREEGELPLFCCET